MPNNDQLMSLLRAILAIIGSVLTTHGTLTSGMWEQISGVVLMAAPMAWGMYVHTESAKVAAVAALAADPTSPVKGVITENSAAGRQLAASIDGTVVSAGSTEAAALAKP
jgi:hypothetical protein